MAVIVRLSVFLGIFLIPFFSFSQECNFEIEYKDPFTYEYTFLTKSLPFHADTSVAITVQGYFHEGNRYLRLNLLTGTPLAVRKGNVLQVKLQGDTTNNKPKILVLRSAVFKNSDHIFQDMASRELAYNTPKIWMISIDFLLSEKDLNKLVKEPVTGLRIHTYNANFDVFPSPEMMNNLTSAVSCIKDPVDEETAGK